MAKSALRIRFTFNQQEGDLFVRSGRQRLGDTFAQSIVEEFAFRYADETYETMAGKIEQALRRDIMRELRHMALLFRRHIIGASGNRPEVSGELDTVLPSFYGAGDPVPIKASLPQWAARSEEYLYRKRRRFHHNRWFERGGRLNAAMTAENWVGAFGPIKVEFERFKNPRMKAANGVARFRTTFGDKAHVKVAIGRIRVFALTAITPSMLPALRSGDPTTFNSDDGNDGLMLLVQSGMGDDIAYRLGARSSEESDRLYRPTLEPFLAFFLTRAVPNAVANRIDSGVLGGRFGNTGGRTRR